MVLCYRLFIIDTPRCYRQQWWISINICVKDQMKNKKLR
ncbi:hypothetical protein F441_08960 [Phytophthora nicotianae CJ01A1]|uniref:Uncharacterized protein n=4 Tax=Phytophthora nicotianae TaxID=4792 RepID=W2Q675_PHYN3|nr:hypothetical protein PPTG_22953 [Phytophthora nicotianae INRA-310]ETK86563.1 hypothetical protein L915_08817 [Phytophthora nicotianae]ETP16429.1 hypothetical protein F441_08960 [Phytophthora nicotianae CJ01A1]ETP44475.1 hypothetical protein F442_08932 [Phytophthora nicotianae P10297]ETL39975.1 hypothetical protein L916_08745 [Phytophthora nicotianae]ETL93100.1 hypothetical protein L917_08665 [Phytophthora nicotianae]